MQGGQRVRDQLGQHDRPQQERRAHAPAALWQDTGVAGGRLGALRISAWSQSRAWQLPRSVPAPPQLLSSSGDSARGRPAAALHWPRVLAPAACPGRRCGRLFTAQESLAICEYLCARFPGAAADKLLPPPGRPRAEVQQPPCFSSRGEGVARSRPCGIAHDVRSFRPGQVHQWVSVEATELRPHALKPCEPPHPTPPRSSAPRPSEVRAGRLTATRALHAPYSRTHSRTHSRTPALTHALTPALSPTLTLALTLALTPARSAPRSAPDSAPRSLPHSPRARPRALHARSPPRRPPARAQADEGAGRARRGRRPGGPPRCAPSTPRAPDDTCAACNPTPATRRAQPLTACNPTCNPSRRDARARRARCAPRRLGPQLPGRCGGGGLGCGCGMG